VGWPFKGLFALALVFALHMAQPLLAPIVIAVVLTFVLAPVVRWLRRHGIPEVAGAALVVLALMGSTVPLVLTLVEPASQWIEKAPATAAQLFDKFDRLRAAVPGLAPPRTAVPPPGRSSARNAPAAQAAPSASPAPDPVKDRIATEGLALTGALLGRSVAAAVATAATLILLYFLLASEHWMLSRCVEAIPSPRRRALLLSGVRAAQREIGRFMASLGIINAAAGTVTALALWALGLPNPTLWGVVVAVLCFVPYIGPAAVMGLLLLAGITTFDSWPQMLGPFLAFALVHAVESNVVSPWFVGRQLSLSPISVFLAVMFWGWLWGIAGALIAVPLLIALRSVCLRTRQARLLCHFLEGTRRGAPPSLRALLQVRPRRTLRAVGPRAGSAADGAALRANERPQNR
jgi:predicted PurR-regulated permease PerM